MVRAWYPAMSALEAYRFGTGVVSERLLGFSRRHPSICRSGAKDGLQLDRSTRPSLPVTAPFPAIKLICLAREWQVFFAFEIQEEKGCKAKKEGC